MRAGQTVREMIRKQMHHDALLLQQVDGSFYLRVLRLDWQRHKDFVNDIIRDNAMQIRNLAETRHVLNAMAVEVCLVVNIPDDAIAKVTALSYLVGKPAGARSTTDNQQLLDVVTAQS